ncbi:MAG: LPD38 domain-containing protein [Sulfurimonas sp.]|nr:LPD38 domain-containing protein [Sulfurimonas sp.]
MEVKDTPAITEQTPQQKLQALESQIKDSDRKAQHRQSVDDIDGATAFKEEADALNIEAQSIKDSMSKEMLRHPRFEELLSMRENISAKESLSPNRLTKKGAARELDGNNGTDKTAYDKAEFEKNYNYDFELTKQDVTDIRAGKFDSNNLAKMETDLGTLDNNPDYAPMSSADLDEANTLFANGGKHLAVGVVNGTNEAYNTEGTIEQKQEAFIKGLLAGTLGSKVSAVALKKISPKLYDKASSLFKDEVKNGKIGMFIGTNPSAKGAFSDVATKKTMSEIDDSKAVYNGEDFKKLTSGTDTPETTVGFVLKHDELYKQYPEIKDIKLVYDKSKTGASFKTTHINDEISDAVITLGGDISAKEAKSVLLHEIQHSIQKIEKWASGGSPDTFKKAQQDKIRVIESINKMDENFGFAKWVEDNKIIEKYREADGKFSPDSFDNMSYEFAKTLAPTKQFVYIKALKDKSTLNSVTDGMKPTEKSFSAYERLWGEQQARATQLRADMTPEQRASESWTDTLKRVEGEYKEPIVRFDDGGVSEHAINIGKNSDTSIDDVSAILDKSSRPYIHKSLSDTTWKKEFNLEKVTDTAKITDVNGNSIDITHAQMKKMVGKARGHYLGLIKPTLEDPTLILKHGDAEVYISRFYDENNKKFNLFAVSKDYNTGELTLTSVVQRRDSQIKNKILEGEVTYVKDHGSVDGTSPSRVASPDQSTGSLDTIIPQTDPNILNANATAPLAGGFAGGSDAVFNQRDYDNDGDSDFADILIGAGIGATTLSAMKLAKPKWFEDGAKHEEKSFTQLGVFAGSKPTPPLKKITPKELEEVSGLPDETILGYGQRLFQDKFNRVKQLINSKSDINKIDDELNIYQTEENLHGRVAARKAEFESDIFNPILEKISRGKVGKRDMTTDDVDLYLWARHAPERNAKMLEGKLSEIATPTMDKEALEKVALKYKDSGIEEAVEAFAKHGDNAPLGKFSKENIEEFQAFVNDKKLHKQRDKITKENASLSGMTNDEAYEIIANYAKNKEMQEIVNAVYKMNRERLKYIKDEGLESDKFIKIIDENYDNYVPLRREFDNADDLAKGAKGFDINGKEFKKAKGSQRKVESPLLHSAMAYHETIMRAEKNRVGKAFYNFAKEFPDEKLYSITSVKYLTKIDANGAVISKDPTAKGDNVLHVKIKGKIREIIIHDELLAIAMKNLNAQQLDGVLKVSHSITRFIASVNTMYNPEFVVSNFQRDIQSAMINMPEEVKGNSLNILKEVPFAMKAIYKQNRNADGKLSAEYEKLFYEMKREGGTTGWSEMYSVPDLKDSSKIIIAKHKGKFLPKQTFKSVLKYVDDVNDMVENSTRLVAYKMARESGLSKAKSANIAKNLTVNFNKKGELGTNLNAVFMFYNASIQGSARIIKQLATNKKTKYIVGGIAGLGYGLDYVNREINSEAYALIPQYIKDTNYILMNKDGTYETVKLPYGYNVFKAMGDMAGAVQHGELPAGDIASRVFSMSINAFSPIGVDADDMLHTVTPTILKPFYEVVTNTNFFGGNVAPEQNPFEPESADSSNYYKSVNPIARNMSQYINDWTGGTLNGEGGISVSPESIEHMGEFVTGGLGKFVARTVKTGSDLYNGEEVDMNKVPFSRLVYAEPRKKAEVQKVYKMYNQSGKHFFTPLEQRRFLKWANKAKDKEHLTIQQSLKMIRQFKQNQALLKFEKDFDIQTKDDFINNAVAQRAAKRVLAPRQIIELKGK